MSTISMTTSFSATPVNGNTPLSATFEARVAFSPEIYAWEISEYRWCFDNSATPKIIETTTDPIISHQFYGNYGQQFDVAVSAIPVSAIAGHPLTGTSAVSSASYVTVGGVDQIRYVPNKELSLTRFLPNKFVDSDVQVFTQLFEDYLNTMFDETILLSTTETLFVGSDTGSNIINKDTDTLPSVVEDFFTDEIVEDYFLAEVVEG